MVFFFRVPPDVSKFGSLHFIFFFLPSKPHGYGTPEWAFPFVLNYYYNIVVRRARIQKPTLVGRA